MREPWGRIVWDIETVPDLPGFAAAKGLEGKNDDEIRVHLATNFLSTSYHSIVCIGALVAHREPERWVVDAFGAPHCGERPEKELIGAFVDRMQSFLHSYSPLMVIRLICRAAISCPGQ